MQYWHLHTEASDSTLTLNRPTACFNLIYLGLVLKRPSFFDMKDQFIALGVVEKELKKKGIPLVEYGEIFHARLGYPVVI